MEMEINPRIKVAIVEVIDTQIALNDPPETALTFTRLIREGFTPSDAKELIGCVVISEVFDVLKSGRKFDGQRYVAALQNLPNLPQDKI